MGSTVPITDEKGRGGCLFEVLGNDSQNRCLLEVSIVLVFVCDVDACSLCVCVCVCVCVQDPVLSDGAPLHREDGGGV